MKRRPETLEAVADALVALRSALNPSKHQFVWDQLSEFAEDIRRIASRWQTIETEPKDDSPRLVSEDPTDNESTYIVRLTADGEHFNGDVVLEDMGIMPTYWHPIPVA